MDLIIILGSPASGKTTLAHRLAQALGLPGFCKDDVKEALFDVLGVADREASRRLSEASFAALVRLARTQLALGLSCIVEGNWRPAHADALEEIVTGSGARAVQICCRADPSVIERRFIDRRRHPGHADAALSPAELKAYAREPAAFLKVAGPRLIYESESHNSYETLSNTLKSWRL